MKRSFLLLFLAVLAVVVTSAQDMLTWITLADISGTSATEALSATISVVRMCQLQAPSTNTAEVRWGDSNTSASRGAAIPPGYGQFIPPYGSQFASGGAMRFDLKTTYVRVVTGDKLRVTCAK
jgi:hypothetical protein